MKTLKHKGYIGSIEYSEEDNCFFGQVLGLKKVLINYEGATAEELNKDFKEGIDFYLQSCDEEGVEPVKSFNGVFNVRVSPDIHSSLIVLAEKNGTSLNNIVKEILQKEVSKI